MTMFDATFMIDNKNRAPKHDRVGQRVIELYHDSEICETRKYCGLRAAKEWTRMVFKKQVL